MRYSKVHGDFGADATPASLLQTLLDSKGSLADAPGKATVAAFQAFYNGTAPQATLKVDGLWGPKTQAALTSYEASAPAASIVGVTATGSPTLSGNMVADAVNAAKAIVAAVTPDHTDAQVVKAVQTAVVSVNNPTTALQAFIAKGGNAGSSEGKSLVQSFQSAFNSDPSNKGAQLKVDGLWGPNTQAALNKMTGAINQVVPAAVATVRVTETPVPTATLASVSHAPVVPLLQRLQALPPPAKVGIAAGVGLVGFLGLSALFKGK